MKVSDALKGVQRLYIETAPWIYYVEVNPAYIDVMDNVIDVIASNAIELVSSAITLTEVLVHPLKLKNTQLEQEYRDILLNSSELRLQPITTRVAESAADLRARYNMLTPDALHVAAAIEAGCDAFLTNDTGIKRVTEITVLILDDLEVDPPAPSVGTPP